MKAPTDLFDWTITLKFLWNKGTIRTLVCESDTVQDLIERVSEFTRIPEDELMMAVGKYILEPDWTVGEMHVPREAVINVLWVGKDTFPKFTGRPSR